MDDFWERDVPQSQTRAIARLATTQHGVIALRQLRELGVSNRVAAKWAEAGRLHRLQRGIYIVGVRRLSARGRWLAAVLACGEGAVLSHRAAAALHGLRPRPAGPIDVSVLARGRAGLDGIRVHCLRAAAQATVVDAIPVTTVARTLLDIACVGRPQQLRLAVEAAERLELFDLREVEALRGRPGAKALRKAIAAAAGEAAWTRSELERRFLAFVRDRGLPEPQTNVLVLGHLVDFWWPAARLVVETDGYAFHRGRAQFEADRRRDADFAVVRVRVLRLTQRRLSEEPARVESDLRHLLDLL